FLTARTYYTIPHFCVQLLLTQQTLGSEFFLSFFLLLPRPPTSTLFPYTTLFRSQTTIPNVVGRDSLERANGYMVTSITTMDDIIDRKSTRLNSSHVSISYAVFCLKKKKH